MSFADDLKPQAQPFSITVPAGTNKCRSKIGQADGARTECLRCKSPETRQPNQPKPHAPTQLNRKLPTNYPTPGADRRSIAATHLVRRGAWLTA